METSFSHQHKNYLRGPKGPGVFSAFDQAIALRRQELNEHVLGHAKRRHGFLQSGKVTKSSQNY